MPDTDPDEVYWRERVSQELTGMMITAELESVLHIGRHPHRMYLRGLEDAADIANEGL